MTNLERYINIFAEILNLNKNEISGVKYQSVHSWDSVGHMSLVSALEQDFEIMMDTDDIIDFDSFEKGKEILEKYGVEF